MNLEEIKAARALGEIAYSNELEWLIAEIERQRLIISGKTQCDERQAAAMECAAIAECYSVETPKGCIKIGAVIGKEIRQRFDL